MDEERARQEPPDKIVHYSTDVRQFLNALEERDIKRLEWLLHLDDKKIERMEKLDEALTWLSKTGKIGKALFYVGLALLGAIVTARTVLDIFFGKGGGTP